MTDDTRGTLAATEPHPAARDAQQWIASLDATELAVFREAFASSALAGNRLAEVCGETLDRLMAGKPVSDRYLLGLSWQLRRMKERNHPQGDSTEPRIKNQ